MLCFKVVISSNAEPFQLQSTLTFVVGQAALQYCQLNLILLFHLLELMSCSKLKTDMVCITGINPEGQAVSM